MRLFSALTAWSFLFPVGILLAVTACIGPSPQEKYPAGGRGRKVEIRYINGSYRLFHQGQPYFIKGAAGDSLLGPLAATGGNTIRTWTTQGLEAVLDSAHRYGLMVLAGLDVVSGRRGLDYSNESEVAAQEERVLAEVKTYKNHPALLMWALGNELELNYKNDDLWPAVNRLAQRVKAEDPEHPVAVILLPEGKSTRGVALHCPEVDVVGFNTFAGLYYLPKKVRQLWWLWRGPYLVSEFGPRGWWELPMTDWQAPLEDPSREKELDMSRRYAASIAVDTTRCLGGFVFFWGQKQEKTHTWFSMFSEQGEKTAMVDAIGLLWTGAYQFNRAPRCNRVFWQDDEAARSRYLMAGMTYTAQMDANDPENDSLFFDWELLPEGDYGVTTGGDRETRPQPVPGHLTRHPDGSVTLTAPSRPGPYRLFAYVRDGKGNFATGNLPFYIIDDEAP